jgi:hypothetical protein
MKYLCMIFFDEKKLDAMSRSELQSLDDESLAYDETLRRSGHFLAAQALQSVHDATTHGLALRMGLVVPHRF